MADPKKYLEMLQHMEMATLAVLPGDKFAEGYNTALHDVAKRIDELVRAIPDFVICKNCKHYTAEVGDDSFALGWCPFIKSHLVMSKGYCAWGEPRDDEEEDHEKNAES